MEEGLEEARERHFWEVVLRTIWTALVVLLVLGVLSWLAVLLGWWKYLLLCVVGLLAGISVSVAAVGSARSRELMTLVLGAITFPIVAIHLAGVAAGSQAAFGAYSASLLPFFAHATAAVLGGLWISRVWQRRPARRELEVAAKASAAEKESTAPALESRPPAATGSAGAQSGR